MNAGRVLVYERASAGSPVDAQVHLPFGMRSRSRFKAVLPSGEELGVMLPRGQVLRGGDRLLAQDGRVIEIAAAAETVTTAHAPEAALLARGAYHLGNRHVPLQVGAGWLRYEHDHVLDAMLTGIGLRLVIEQQPFEPEAGAYHSHGAAHAHGATDAHAHAHPHPHGDEPVGG